MDGMIFLNARLPVTPNTTRASDSACRVSATRHEPEAADMPAVRHAFGQLGLAVGEAREQREVELADLRILHRELVEDAIVSLDGWHAAGVRPETGVVTEPIHDPGQFLDPLPAAGRGGGPLAQLSHD